MSLKAAVTAAPEEALVAEKKVARYGISGWACLGMTQHWAQPQLRYNVVVWAQSAGTGS